MSMILAGVPDVEARMKSLQQELYNRNRELSEAETRIADLEAELVRERAKSLQTERGAQKLRSILSPLHDALMVIFGELEDVAPSAGAASVATGNPPEKSAVWESWKKKLGGLSGEAIDALLVHGEMSNAQLRIHLKCRLQTVYEVVSKLNKAGIVTKNNGKVALKQL